VKEGKNSASNKKRGLGDQKKKAARRPKFKKDPPHGLQKKSGPGVHHNKGGERKKTGTGGGVLAGRKRSQNVDKGEYGVPEKALNIWSREGRLESKSYGSNGNTTKTKCTRSA